MLSEGRIEADGTLACAYHGWRFNGEGKCTSLPQTYDKEELQKATSNKKSCAQSYPVQVCLVLMHHAYILQLKYVPNVAPCVASSI